MPSTASRWLAQDCRLCPVRCLQIEDDQVVEIGSVLIFAAEDKKLIALVQSCGMPYVIMN
jgi:hypothetical protein